MRPRTRLLAALGLVSALGLGAGCSIDETPVGPSSELPWHLRVRRSDVALLPCDSLPYARKTATIGPGGGTLKFGLQQLVIPAGALSQKVEITAEQVADAVVSVRFAPEGLRFAKPATLTLSYGRCLPIAGVKGVVYTDDQLDVLELIPSQDELSGEVAGWINHFSRYAVAF